MSALQRKYFGKKHKAIRAKRHVSKRRRINVSKYKKHYSRARIGGGMKSMLSPILAGVADNVIDSYSPIDGLGAVMVGMFMHNQTVKDIGLYKVGFSAGNFLPIPRGGSGTGGLL
jgi:hypothetical protein